MVKFNLISTHPYKGKTIVKADNGLCEFIFIVGLRLLFGSVADAKRFLNDYPTTWSIIDTTLWEDGFNEGVDALVAEHNL